MHICVFGLNHNTAPVEIREKCYISDDSTPHVLNDMKEAGIRESVVVSTCNRTEIYFCCDNPDEAIEKISNILQKRLGIDKDPVYDYTYILQDEEAYKHLFLVASGLDSMVIGEPQILGQVKDAYRTATSQNATGFLLDKVFHRTFNVAKRIRSETKIGYNPVSISSMAIELAKKIFGELNNKKILVIGAGEMCEVALKYFKKEGLNEIFIANRSLVNAGRLADNIIGIPQPFDKIPILLTKVDMILSSTGSDKPIIDKDTVISAMKKRKNKPLFFIDIAVPRDIEPGVNDIENVYLYDIDDLKELSYKHLADRFKESEKAHIIVEEEAARFSRWLDTLDVNPLITHIVEATERTRNKELKKLLHKNKDLDDDIKNSIDILTKSIVNKLIHPHISLVKKNGNPAVMDVMKKLFKFEDEDEKEMDSGDKG